MSRTPRVFKLARSPFLGHPTGNPPSLAAVVESPKSKPAPPRFTLTPPPKHKPKSKRKIKVIQNPPAIGAGVVAFFDGAFEGGRAAFGAVVYRNGERIHKAAEIVPAGQELSCNCAEYAGAINVLRLFQREGIRHATIYGDSLLVVKQLNAAWRAKQGAYLPFYLEAIKLRRTLPDVRLVWINRENNTEADELSKLPLCA